MGMPVTVEISDESATQQEINRIFDYFRYVDEKFSTYKDTSEITAINKGRIKSADFSDDMKTVFRLSEKTKKESDGYFDIMKPDGSCDPSGLVKGWAIFNAAEILRKDGFKEFYVDAGGDVEVNGKVWRIGIKNPFEQKQIVKAVYLKNAGIATSGTYIRGDHIYNPKNKNDKITDVASLTVIGPNVYEADRFATAAFAMGKKGIEFIEKLDGFEGYMIDNKGIATMTSGFEKYTRSE